MSLGEKLKKIGLDGIYVVHAKKGYEQHEKRIKKVFSEYSLSFEFVTDGDPANFTEDILNKYFCSEINSILRKGVLSCTLNHIYCYRNMIINNDRFAIVFENDVYFLDNFSTDVEKVLLEASFLNPGFIISLENTALEFPHFSVLKKNKHIYSANCGRMAGAYLIDQTAAKNILTDLEKNKCCQVIDWWHNKLILNNVIKMYWAYPAITEQGSHNGLMSSTISMKPKSTIRRFSWLYQKFYKTYISRWFKRKA